jgi:hypothetical protein
MKEVRRTEEPGGEIRGEQMRKRGGSRNRRSMKGLGTRAGDGKQAGEGI